MRAIDPVGPDQSDLRLCRPYYVLPIAPEKWDKAPGPSEEDERAAIERIRQAISTSESPITDIYVISHGWHRNFYGAVSTYDRLLSRMTRLLFRGQISPPSNDYNPLFICVHWKSEVGDDIWVDFAGRRHRDDYIKLAKERFAASGPNFERFLDQAFEVFSEFSAPDGGDRSTHSQASGLLLNQLAQSFPLVNEPANPPNGVSSIRAQALWSCYHEAVAKGVRSAQSARPTAFAPGSMRLMIVLKFVLGALPIMALLGFILGEKPKQWWTALKAWVHDPQLSDNWPSFLRPAVDILRESVPYAARWVILWLLLTAVFGVIFWASCAYSRSQRKDGHKGGVGWVTLIAWAPVQLTFAAPVLTALLLQYVLFFFPFLRRYQFSERTRRAPGPQPTISGPLATLARVPSLYLLGSMNPGDAGREIVTMADSQLAFFFMQRRGVETGRSVAKFFHGLIHDEDPTVQSVVRQARFYLAGHSFGGLVVANAARSYYQLQREELLAANPNAAPNELKPNFPVHSLAFIEGALASGWFKIEHNPVYNIQNRLSCIYSGADSATGFYYPLANAGRLAMGSVGLCDVPGVGFRDPVLKVAQKPCPPGCTEQHVHKAPIYAVLAGPPSGMPKSPTGPTVTNFDGSKMIYEGSVAAGGGHTDIYKDDVTYLLWVALHG